MLCPKGTKVSSKVEIGARCWSSCHSAFFKQLTGLPGVYPSDSGVKSVMWKILKTAFYSFAPFQFLCSVWAEVANSKKKKLKGTFIFNTKGCCSEINSCFEGWGWVGDRIIFSSSIRHLRLTRLIRRRRLDDLTYFLYVSLHLQYISTRGSVRQKLSIASDRPPKQLLTGVTSSLNAKKIRGLVIPFWVGKTNRPPSVRRLATLCLFTCFLTCVPAC